MYDLEVVYRSCIPKLAASEHDCSIEVYPSLKMKVQTMLNAAGEGNMTTGNWTGLHCLCEGDRCNSKSVEALKEENAANGLHPQSLILMMIGAFISFNYL